MTEQLRDVLNAAAHDPDALDLLRRDPDGFADRFHLGDAERERLRRSTRLIRTDRNPLSELASDVIMLPPITITGHPQVTFTTEPITITVIAADAPSGGPKSLDELDREQLQRLAVRVLSDPEFAERVRTFLKL